MERKIEIDKMRGKRDRERVGKKERRSGTETETETKIWTKGKRRPEIVKERNVLLERGSG